tara:strand:- start:1478 stop:2374 length:897 start_codon:yes stop_codon:yes gene_type:complete
MKIGYFADGPWSHKAFQKIIANEDLEISFIVPRYDSQDQILKQYAEKNKIDYLLIENVNLDKSIKLLSSYEADLFVSMSYNQILKNKIINLPPKGFINCHAGALPFYRGRNILNWVLINDEKEFGVTVHYIDEGIDTGDIILQKKQKINDNDNYSSLLNKATILCSELLYESIIQILKSKVKKIRQEDIDPVGSYFKKRGIGDEIIDWNWTSRKIFNFVRAISFPGPFAQSYLNDECILISKAFFIKLNYGDNYKPGDIIEKKNDSIIVKTGDSHIAIKILNTNEKNIKIGNRFENSK